MRKTMLGKSVWTRCGTAMATRSMNAAALHAVGEWDHRECPCLGPMMGIEFDLAQRDQQVTVGTVPFEGE
jgi:hypothetical protein